ncbi:unnamed protein product [Arctogadus glacialis]
MTEGRDKTQTQMCFHPTALCCVVDAGILPHTMVRRFDHEERVNLIHSSLWNAIHRVEEPPPSEDGRKFPSALPVSLQSPLEWVPCFLSVDSSQATEGSNDTQSS